MGNLIRLFQLFALVFLCLNTSGLWGQRITDLKSKALEGDAGSQVQLGFIYSQGPLKDRKEALYWMTMAARKGMPSACRYVGFAYLEGKGTAQNKNLARKWFSMGSRKGDTLSMIGLAECLSEQEERIECTAWLLLAKDLGEPRSLWRLDQSMTKLNTIEKTKAREEATKLKTTLATGSSRQPPKLFIMKKNSLTLQNGSSYRGAIKNELPHGFGERISQDGEIYQGSFQGGKEEGYGTLFSPQGLIIYQGLWIKGNPTDKMESPQEEAPSNQPKEE
jgi:hypothetical protein